MITFILIFSELVIVAILVMLVQLTVPDYDNFQETEQYLISPQINYSDDDFRASLTYSIIKDDLLGQRDVSDKTQSFTDEQSVDLIIENQLTDNFLLTIGSGYSKTKFEEDGLSPFAPSPWKEGNSWEQKSGSIGLFHAKLSEINEVKWKCKV